MFRFREVERKFDIEKAKEEEEKNKAYKKIKPETDITTDECNKFWNDLFLGLWNEAE